jgi:hypothetical protein
MPGRTTIGKYAGTESRSSTAKSTGRIDAGLSTLPMIPCLKIGF